MSDTVESSAPLPRHLAVMPNEVMTWLDPRPGQTIVDCTVGAGGHAALICERLGTHGRLIGLDQDATMLASAQTRLAGCPVHLLERNFGDLRQVLDELGIDAVDGVLADLGFASDQMENPARGFSFHHDGPLDMRLNPDAGEMASDLVARWTERTLADVFWEYGEERFSRRIARRIVETREREPITTTRQLAELVRRCVPRQRSGIDPATRVFQALRIAVNDELGALDRLLEALPVCVKPNGRAVVISFHSLEDRRVKRSFRQAEYWTVLTKKPVMANVVEVHVNPRSRSAKLRAAQRLQTGR
jgi:16S rRNA (cytosine1402-N4)-methyltransferase